MTLTELQEELQLEQTKRSTVRKLVALAMAAQWSLIVWFMPQVPIVSLPEMGITLVKLLTGAVGAVMILRVLNRDSIFYWPGLAKGIYGSYAPEEDRLGAEVNLNYVLGSTTFKTALALRRQLTLGHNLTYLGQPVVNILPLTVKNSAIPDCGTIYVKTTNSTHHLGIRHFIYNLLDFQYDTMPTESLYTALFHQMATIDEYVESVIREVYFGKAVPRSVFYPHSEPN